MEWNRMKWNGTESNGIEWNRMESNRMESNGISCLKSKLRGEPRRDLARRRTVEHGELRRHVAPAAGAAAAATLARARGAKRRVVLDLTSERAQHTPTNPAPQTQDGCVFGGVTGRTLTCGATSLVERDDGRSSWCAAVALARDRSLIDV